MYLLMLPMNMRILSGGFNRPYRDRDAWSAKNDRMEMPPIGSDSPGRPVCSRSRSGSTGYRLASSQTLLSIFPCLDEKRRKGMRSMHYKPCMPWGYGVAPAAPPVGTADMGPERRDSVDHGGQSRKYLLEVISFDA